MSSSTRPNEHDAETEILLAELRESYRMELPRRLGEIRDLRQSIQAGSVTAKEMDRLVLLVHNIVGSGATLGLTSLSEAAKYLENQLVLIPVLGLSFAQQQIRKIDTFLALAGELA